MLRAPMRGANTSETSLPLSTAVSATIQEPGGSKRSGESGTEHIPNRSFQIYRVGPERREGGRTQRSSLLLFHSVGHTHTDGTFLAICTEGVFLNRDTWTHTKSLTDGKFLCSRNGRVPPTTRMHTFQRQVAPLYSDWQVPVANEVAGGTTSAQNSLGLLQALQMEGQPTPDMLTCEDWGCWYNTGH